METLNLDRWRYWMRDVCSPDSFIELGYYLLISACLQRRVWFGDDTKQTYLNMFAVLCAEAGVGKGLVTKEIGKVLTHKKMLKSANLEESRKQLEEELGPLPEGKNKNERIENMIIPVAPNAITYEELVSTMAKSGRTMWFDTGQVNASGKVIRKPMIHSSILFNLDEMESLFHRESQKIHAFLNECYDCGDDYEYKTKHQGADYIRRPCINLIAGTTPHFLKRVFSSTLLQEGFASRTLFAVESKSRFRRYAPPTRDADQVAEYEKLVDHVRKVAALQGPISWTDEALEFNKHWFEVEYGKKLPNPHPKLIPYYARANITHTKLAAALHFGESLETKVGLEVAQRALAFQQKLEINMHRAVGLEQKNPLSAVTDDIESFMGRVGRAVTKKELISEFYHAFPGDPWVDINKVLAYLKDSGKIEEDPSGKPNSFKIAG